MTLLAEKLLQAGLVSKEDFAKAVNNHKSQWKDTHDFRPKNNKRNRRKKHRSQIEEEESDM